ncbi:MAG TPA: hypothetical protein VH021_18680 [Trebonia sp.]|nr:hypothetical protein [Trebonia sp.]
MVVTADNWVTIASALARPDVVELAALALTLALALGALLLGALLELELELLQAASTAAAVIAAPGATHRFHLCVIALMPPSQGYCCHIPPTTTCA